MSARRFVTVVAAAASMLLLSGCHSPVVTMVTPPGWVNEGPKSAAAGPTLDEVRFAVVPSVCGAPGGALQDGALVPAPASTAIGGGQADPAATSIRIADDPVTGAPLVALAADADGAVGAAAIFACEFGGDLHLDRVVVWDAELEPVDVIDLAALRGTGDVVGLAMTVGGETVRVQFQEVGSGTSTEPKGEVLRVPLTIDTGQLVVGALTIV